MAARLRSRLFPAPPAAPMPATGSICPHCQTDLRAAVRFCVRCGAYVGGQGRYPLFEATKRRLIKSGWIVSVFVICLWASDLCVYVFYKLFVALDLCGHLPR